MKSNRYLAVLLAAFMLANFSTTRTWASSGNPISRIPWNFRAEILEYYSCGVADACWVAQVKNSKTKKQIAMLRCDGAVLYTQLAAGREKIAANNCKAFEEMDKFQKIPEALRALLKR